jgi:hypothetical protein
MVLLLIEMAPNNCMTEANLQLVCNVMNKRHGLQLGSGLDHFHQMLNSLNELYIERGPYGFRLDEGGRAELEEIHRRQAPFCCKFKTVASPIINRTVPPRSCSHATVRIQMPRREEVWASV